MNIAIIGSGTMGSGIAQVAATAGCSVKVYDTSKQALDKSKDALEIILSRLVEKGKMDETEKSRIQNSISYVDSLKELSDADLTIEAIIENAEIKEKVFTELESYQSYCIKHLVAFHHLAGSIFKKDGAFYRNSLFQSRTFNAFG